MTKSPFDKGWAKSAPKRGADRERMLKRCGDSCFLMPNRKSPGKSKFPVCAVGSCKKDCKGVLSALIRAQQWKHKHPSYAKAAKKARSLYGKHKCGKQSGKKSRKQSGKKSRKQSGKKSRKQSGKKSRKQSGKKSRKHRADSSPVAELDKLLAKQRSHLASDITRDVDKGLSASTHRRKSARRHSKHRKSRVRCYGKSRSQCKRTKSCKLVGMGTSRRCVLRKNVRKHVKHSKRSKR
jgi:hypothetical protein